MNTKLVVTNPKQLYKALSSLWSQYKAYDGKWPLEVIIQPFKRRRNNPQNARLWVLHSKAAMAINMLTLKSGQNKGQKWTREDMHDLFKEMYCGSEYVEINGRKLFRIKSSTDMQIDEMAEAQEKYLAYLISDLGLEIELEEDGEK